MIIVEELTKSFGKKSLFSNISFSITEGEVCGLVGLNGIGKTTLLRILCGTLTIDSGKISVLGTTPSGNGAFFRRMGVVLDSDGFNGNLTFRENLNFFAKAKRVQRDEVARYCNQFWSHLAEKPTPVKQFSRGERMQCSLARAFLGSPELLLLDEPASNLDMNGYDLLCSLVNAAKERGATTIISSHRLDAISDLCENALFLNENGIQKHSLLEESESEWVIRGNGIERAGSIIEEAQGTVISITSDSLIFRNVTKEKVAALVPLFVQSNIDLWELFQKDRVSSVWEQL